MKQKTWHSEPALPNPTSLPPPLIAKQERQDGVHCWKAFVALVPLVASLYAVHALLQLSTRTTFSQAPLRSESVDGDFDWYALEPSSDIRWVPCFDNHECARVLLPLDYSRPTDGRTTAIALRVVPSKLRGTPGYRGTFFLNPGGPGIAGAAWTGAWGAGFGTIAGGGYDVLGFDPRGTGASTPRASCFTSDAERKIWNSQAGHRLLNASDAESVGLYLAREKAVGERCADRIGGEDGIGRFMGTASVATDMAGIMRKMGMEKMNYWGFSYGSILGQYFAAMFPDKVGRFVIDGIYDAEDFRAAQWHSNLDDVEAVIDKLFDLCHEAGPSRCDTWEPSPDLIRQRYYNVLDSVKLDPVPIPLADPPIVVTELALLNQLLGATYGPNFAWSTIASTVRALETRNQTSLASLARTIASPVSCDGCVASPAPWRMGNDAIYPVTCGDGDPHAFDPELFATYYAAISADAPRLAPVYARHLGASSLAVHGRAAAPNGTASPMLVVQPRFDPICPLSAARRVRARFPGAGLLVQDSHGHCSFSAPSVCTAKYVRAYFEEGRLPEEGASCAPDVKRFGEDVGNVAAGALWTSGTVPQSIPVDRLASSNAAIERRQLILTGGNYDILGFDPRGTGESTPQASCFDTDSERKIWLSQAGHQTLNASKPDTVGLYYARERAVGERCASRIGGEDGIARYMSTSSVVRDMVEIGNQLGKRRSTIGDSYGTVLGQYFASMFPDKVGRFAIDGVFDGYNYRAAKWSSNLVDMDATINSLFDSATWREPKVSPLGSSVPRIRRRYFDVLEGLKDNPVPISLADPPILATQLSIMALAVNAAYSPLTLWPFIAATIRAIEDTNSTWLATLAPILAPSAECKCETAPVPLGVTSNEAFYPIACGDAEENPFDRAAFAKHFEELSEVSPLAAPVWARIWLSCAAWPTSARSVWRYMGPLAAPNGTRTPMLILQPRYDPVCPLQDARRVRARFPGAGLLVQESYGHCTIAAPSLCTAKHVRAYFNDGTMPAEGATCEADVLPFVGNVRDMRAMSADDAALFYAVSALSEAVPRWGNLA
ncbi:TAP-like protein-domain-containing protein [Epithele typhae]|uniref:TAP-like protein-domain-containing protein n=1 Tax=Epithele typhae TaxID=378194 RepID=UPI002008373D|nr:TAP-like protein-domain-containing protein [Epithele typhae]KAH9922870.1 TAP-like protein-domain-containing protein [Epithele typhae]